MRRVRRTTGPEEAYRFARGEEITAANGMKVKLSRPLDFIVVADHSDNMGFFPKLFAGDPSYLADPTGKRWYDMIQKGGQDAVGVATEVIDTFSKGTFPPALASMPGTETYRSAWEKDIRAAEANNEPGRFSAFIGYEWTSNTGGNNLHRVVVFRDGADKARRSRAVHDDQAARQRRSQGPVEGAAEPTKTRPVATSSRSRTTAISPTASCFRKSTRSPASRSRASTPRHAPSGNSSTRRRR